MMKPTISFNYIPLRLYLDPSDPLYSKESFWRWLFFIQALNCCGFHSVTIRFCGMIISRWYGDNLSQSDADKIKQEATRERVSA